MGHEERVVEAFRSNDIKRILLIDDAYDPPELNDTIVSEVADFLDKEENRETIRHKCGIQQTTLDAAIVAADEGNSDSGELGEVYRALYVQFMKTKKDTFDPEGRFKLVKESALSTLSPLQTLLHKCGDEVEVFIAGLEDGKEKYKEVQPEILFLDYYLADDVPAVGDTDMRRMDQARKVSLDLLGSILKATDDQDIPAIVLMSSQNVKEINQYRHEAKDKQILSLRFGFLQKKMIKLQKDKTISIDHAAVDVLLDMSQGYIFGKFLQQALTQWRNGAQSALNKFIKEVGDLDIKDFAYLLRFRLREEAQPLSEYLGWFFGECLKGQIDNEVDWEHPSFARLDDNKEIEEKIEGAFEGPSVKIAEFFHRVRVNGHQVGVQSGRYRLGDLYARPEECEIRAVITADCDLVVRKGKTKTRSVLTMGGTLDTFDKDSSAVDDFFFREKIPYTLRWNPKDLETFPIKGPESLQSLKFQHLGTLRSLYAQEMQRRALTDLSRMGLPMAPALGVNAAATVWIRTKDASNPFEKIDIESPVLATIIPSRAGQTHGHRVLLRRRFVNELIDKLREMDPEKMTVSDAKLLKRSLKDVDKIYRKFLREGGLTKEKGPFGMNLSIGDKPDTKRDSPWLQIALKVSTNAMADLQAIDPLIALPYEGVE